MLFIVQLYVTTNYSTIKGYFRYEHLQKMGISRAVLVPPVLQQKQGHHAFPSYFYLLGTCARATGQKVCSTDSACSPVPVRII